VPDELLEPGTLPKNLWHLRNRWNLWNDDEA